MYPKNIQLFTKRSQCRYTTLNEMVIYLVAFIHNIFFFVYTFSNLKETFPYPAKPTTESYNGIVFISSNIWLIASKWFMKNHLDPALSNLNVSTLFFRDAGFCNAPCPRLVCLKPYHKQTRFITTAPDSVNIERMMNRQEYPVCSPLRAHADDLHGLSKALGRKQPDWPKEHGCEEI